MQGETSSGGTQIELPPHPGGLEPGHDISSVPMSEESLRAALEELPCMAFFERWGELTPANSLSSAALGGIPAVSVVETFLGDYPALGDERRQRFECLFLPPVGRPVQVSGAVQPTSLRDASRLILLMEPVNSSESSGKGTFLQDLFDSSPEAMVVIQDGRILHANREFVRIFEYPLSACLGAFIDDLVLPEGRLHESEILFHNLGIEGRSTIDTVRRTSSGAQIEVSVLLTRVRLSGDRMGFSVTYRDIRSQKQAEARLQHSALHDGLTGLANRLLFLDRLNLTMARLHRRPDRNFAVVFLDVDRFKQVNDVYGHAAGDELLLAIAARLKVCLRPQDTIARFGGDEFALLLDEGGSLADIATVAERIQSEIQKPVDLGMTQAFVSASMGIALGALSYNDADEIMHDADAAMYRAKANGKARHEMFDAASRQSEAVPEAGESA